MGGNVSQMVGLLEMCLVSMGYEFQAGSVLKATIDAVASVQKVYAGMQVGYDSLMLYQCSIFFNCSYNCSSSSKILYIELEISATQKFCGFCELMSKHRNIIRKCLLNHAPNVIACVSTINLPVFYS